MFISPDIGKLMEEINFGKKIILVEKDAWLGFISIVDCFLGNKIYPQLRDIAENMLNSYKSLGCNICIEVHFFTFLSWMRRY